MLSWKKTLATTARKQRSSFGGASNGRSTSTPAAGRIGERDKSAPLLPFLLAPVRQ